MIPRWQARGFHSALCADGWRSDCEHGAINGPILIGRNRDRYVEWVKWHNLIGYCPLDRDPVGVAKSHRWYIGHYGGERYAFHVPANVKPTVETHGAVFTAVTGPFHCRICADAYEDIGPLPTGPTNVGELRYCEHDPREVQHA